MNSLWLLSLMIFGIGAIGNQDPCSKIDCAPAAEGSLYLRCYDFHIPIETKPDEFSYVLMKGTTYYFTFAKQLNSTTFEIKDKSRTNVLTSPNSVHTISFSCNATGIYYFKFNSTTQCGVATFSFKRT